MKKNILNLGMIALAVLAFSSCKKDSSDDASVYLVKTEATNDGSSTSTDTYTYDSDDRATRVANSDGSYIDYVYGASTVTEISVDGANRDTIVYTLNSDGLASESSDGYFFDYDADGHMVVITDGTDSIMATYTDGNLTTLTYRISGSTMTETNTYDTSKDETRSFGDGFLGMGSANLLTSNVYNGVTTNYTYEFDASTSDKITKRTGTATGSTETKTFTY